jgi:hypothetical protein
MEVRHGGFLGYSRYDSHVLMDRERRLANHADSRAVAFIRDV